MRLVSKSMIFVGTEMVKNCLLLVMMVDFMKSTHQRKKSAILLKVFFVNLPIELTL